MKYTLYDILLHIFIIVLSPWFLIKGLLNEKYKGSLAERFAIYNEMESAVKDCSVVWFHAVSVGETRAVIPLLKRFKEKHPDVKIVFSTVTKTGRELAKKEGAGLIEKVIYMPLDLSWVVKSALKKIRPALFIIVEKEYWPNMIHITESSGIPVLVINATISKRSYSRYRSLSLLFADCFSKISLFCAKRSEDAKRAASLGVKKDRVHRVGNIKFDMEAPDGKTQTEGLRETLAIKDDDLVIVAGSTHPGEELILLDVFKELKAEFPEVKLIIAPRHPNRFDEVERVIKEAGLSVTRRSQCTGARDGVILLDTVGELFMVYSLASINFVGGSLVPIGGHNLLEPAYHSAPVLYGPHIETCADMAALLEEAGGGLMVENKESLTRALAKLLKDKNKCHAMGERAKAALEANRGATEKTIELIETLNVL